MKEANRSDSLKASRTICHIVLLVSLIALQACTTIGMSNPWKLKQIDYGEKETIRVCILKDAPITQERVDDLVKALEQELSLYGIALDVPWVKNWDRPGFWSDTILGHVASIPLTTSCDRLLAFSGRNTGDILWGLLLPEVLGSVEGVTHTKGFVFAEYDPSAVIVFMTPKSILVHEFYHMLGCGHGIIMNSCYEQIKVLKDAARQERKNGKSFFPSITSDGKILRTHNEVENEFYQLMLKHIRNNTSK